MTAPPTSTLDQLADLVWPSRDGSPRILRASEPLPTGWRELERYQVMGYGRQAAYLLPLDCPRRARARLLREYNDLRYLSRRSMRRALADATALGLARPRRPNVVRIAAPVGWSGTSLRSRTGQLLGRDPESLVLATSVREAAGGIRPTVTVADLTGAPVAFLKVANTDLHRARLMREHDALVAVAAAPVPGMHAPEPLFCERWEHRIVLGVAPLPVDVRRVDLLDAEATWPVLDALHRHNPTVGPLSGLPWAVETTTRIEALEEPFRSQLRTELDRICERHADREHVHGQRHGDWSPWNLARTGDGRLAVWDWEFAQPSAPVGLDQLNWHFALQTSYRGVSFEDATAALERAVRREPGLPSDLTDVFLLDMAVRRAEEARPEHAGSLDVARRLLALVQSC